MNPLLSLTHRESVAPEIQQAPPLYRIMEVLGSSLFFLIALLHHLTLLGISREPWRDESGFGDGLLHLLCGHCSIVSSPDLSL